MLIHSEVTLSVFRKLVLLDLLPHGLLPPTLSPPARQSDTQPQAGSFLRITWPLWSPLPGQEHLRSTEPDLKVSLSPSQAGDG